MEFPLEVGVLARPQKLTQRVCDILDAAGWRVRRISTADLVGRDSFEWDVTLLVPGSAVPEIFDDLIEAARVPGVPVIVVGSVTEPQVVADVLRTGADDYIVHPFAAEELLARIENLVYRFPRHMGTVEPTCFTMDRRTRTIAQGHSRAVLSPREWALFESLLTHDAEYVSLESLSRTAGLTGLTQSAIVSTVSRLRRRLLNTGFDGLAIHTVRGRGYQLQRPAASECFKAASMHN
jgi:DNA-binding response OmpR family regulator